MLAGGNLVNEEKLSELESAVVESLRKWSEALDDG